MGYVDAPKGQNPWTSTMPDPKISQRAAFPSYSTSQGNFGRQWNGDGETNAGRRLGAIAYAQSMYVNEWIRPQMDADEAKKAAKAAQGGGPPKLRIQGGGSGGSGGASPAGGTPPTPGTSGPKSGRPLPGDPGYQPQTDAADPALGRVAPWKGSGTGSAAPAPSIRRTGPNGATHDEPARAPWMTGQGGTLIPQQSAPASPNGGQPTTPPSRLRNPAGPSRFQPQVPSGSALATGAQSKAPEQPVSTPATPWHGLHTITPAPNMDTAGANLRAPGSRTQTRAENAQMQAQGPSLIGALPAPADRVGPSQVRRTKGGLNPRNKGAWNRYE